MADDVRMTIRRLDALRFARGDEETCPPTMGVAGPLEKAGLISWNGWKPGLPVAMKSVGRGWYITAKGEGVLERWLQAEGFDDPPTDRVP